MEIRSLGMRRDRIVFQRRFRDAAPDAQGRVRNEWQDISPQMDTDLIPIRSGDEVMAGRIGGVTAYRVKPWYHPSLENLTVSDRAVDTRNPNRIFKVESVMIGPERDFVDVVMTQGGAT